MRRHRHIKHIAIGTIIGILITFGGMVAKNTSQSILVKPTPTPVIDRQEGNITPLPSIGSGCDQTLWDHIYHPSRLQVIESCKTITGVVEVMRVEKDGDFHVLFKLDSEFSNLINQVNIDKQHGDLVIEPICENPVTQTNAISACQNFRQNFNIKIGDRLQVTGAYVTDLQHGWNEIHPITSITKL